MADSAQTTRFRFWLWLIALVGVIVPRRLRADWRQEWESELRNREAMLEEWDRLDWQSKVDLLWRSASAFWDALLLQPRRWEDEMFQDLRFGLRMLRKNPVLALVVVFTLALGIGVNTVVFSVVNGLLLRARVDKDPDSFIHLSPQYSGQFDQRGLAGAISLTDYRAYLAEARSLTDMAAWAIARVRFGDDSQNQLALLVTDNFFSLYGLAQPKLGRLFLADEYAVPDGVFVVILSEEIWRNRFGADPQIIGAVIKLNRQPFTVVGVIPSRFSGRLRGPGIWIPYTMQPQFFGGQNFFQKTGAQWLTVEARLRAGRARATAQAELDIIARQLDQFQPRRQTTMALTNGSLLEEPTLRAKLFWVPWLIMSALSLVLFITCLNVTLLLLARAAARQREMAVRLALGAGRRRLLRMLLTESLILAAAAGAISAYLVYQSPGIFEKTFAEAPNYPLRPDWLVFVYLAGVTLLAGCVAGSAPAFESLKVNLSATLNGNGSLFGGGKTKWKARDLLVGAQVAMSVALLALAGIFLRAQYTMFTTDPGFETRQVLLAPLQAEPGRYTTDAAVAFNRALEQRARALPGVQAVCYASAPPGSGGGFDAALEEFRLPGQAKGTGKPAGVNVVSADFFETFRIPIVAGRTFRDAEATAKGIAAVAVVSETFARSLWGNENPLEKVIEDASGERWRVVGVARDAKSIFGGVEGPQFYRLFNPQYVGSSLMIRFAGDARPLAEGLRNAVGDLDREMTITPQTLRSLLDEQAARFWVIVRMILLLGVVAMLIAVIGIYGVVAFAINQRTKEIGIRMALGATKNDIMRWALRLGLKPILAGLAIGLALAVTGALAMEQVLREIPVGFKTRDPLIYIAVTALLSLVVAPAIFGPALRASKADPIRALRQD